MEELKRLLSVHDTDLSLKLKQQVDTSAKLEFNASLKFDERNFFESCYYGEESVVNRMIERGVDVNLKDCHNKSAAHWTVEGHEYECTNVLRLLKKHGINLDVLNSDGLTPLHVAIIAGENILVETLVELGANVNLKICKDYSPLYVAICLKWNQPWKCTDASNDGASVHSDTTYEDDNDDDEAVRSSIIKCLIKAKNIELQEFTMMKQQLSYFQYAALYGDDETTKLCPNALDNAKNDFPNQLPYLLVGGCAGFIDSIASFLINVRSLETKETPLHLAVKHACLETVTTLVAKGANCNLLDKQNLSPLHIALKNINVKVEAIKFRKQLENRCINMQRVIEGVKTAGFGENYNLAMVVYMIKYGNANPFQSNDDVNTYVDLIPGSDADKLKIVNHLYKVKSKKFEDVEQLLKSQKRKFEELNSSLHCTICATGHKAIVFNCGHCSCETCSGINTYCRICDIKITKRLKLK